MAVEVRGVLGFFGGRVITSMIRVTGRVANGLHGASLPGYVADKTRYDAVMRPSESTLKRLFANSGNRCPFPNCKAPLVVGETLIGEVCHIKGDKHGAARYDAAQPENDRQAYGNLIVMCPTHHTVIDDDVDSYTVDRLVRMKAEHEAGATPLSDPESARLAVNFLDASFRNVGQSGGIAAQNFHAQTLNVHNGAVTDATLQARRLQAVESIWQIIKELAGAFDQLIFVDDILTREEIDGQFKNGWKNGFDKVTQFKNEQQAIWLLNRLGAFTIERERPFVSQRAWAVYFVIRALYGRLAYLFERSFAAHSYQIWTEDSGVDQLLRSVLPPNAVIQIKALPFGGLRNAIDHLEEQFMAEANMRT